MRNIIIDSIFNKMKEDKDIYFLTADMGINLVEKFRDNFPERFANVGIAEQNLIGVAAGLANTGFRPFVYSISNFLIHRCLEQVRNDVILHQYPITLIGTSTGYDNSPLGPTHHVIDDWGLLKSFPNIDIYCPASQKYADKLINKVLLDNRPTYIRIPKGNFENPVSSDDIIYIEGDKEKPIYVSYGSPSQFILKKRPNSSHLIVNKLHPLDQKILTKILQKYHKAVVIEDHFASTGLFSSIAAILVNEKTPHLVSMAPRKYDFTVGENIGYFHDKFILLGDH